MLNKLSSLFITGLDVLDDLEEIKVCSKYKIGETIVDGILPPLINEFG
jgi:adenylosuccinate synthase